MVWIEYDCSVQQVGKTQKHDVLSVQRILPASMIPQGVTVAFQRTVRVPDNDCTSALPPDLGYFPIYKTQDYASRLPPGIVRDGGVFIPMYQKEAMWVRFHATSPFMVKIYVGGVNAISGENASESEQTREHRAALRSMGCSIQDYVVVPSQLWLDGVAIDAGVVRQFVAMPVSQGYTVEAQLTGSDVLGGMQIEITPAMRKAVTASYQIFVTTLSGKTIAVPCGPEYSLSDVKSYESTLYLSLRLRGGNPDHQLGIAPGGLINQQVRADNYNPKDWLRGLTFSFPVHILNSEAFRAITGTNPPPSPIDAKTYAQAGLPFFELYEEEESGIFGFESFDALKSVYRLEGERGLVGDVEQPVQPEVVAIYEGPPQLVALQDWQYGEDIVQVHNPDGVLSPAGPRREVRTLADLEAEMDKLCIQPWSR
ncbi:hypothetical protein VPNG_08084 [Cytospora leucostoma]|uniref:Integral membrane protein n=1 Tax=Cytospora leucostoma TaxID=1230097 RepID=A0A423WS59_9PEZI|nr:hypothetical protein VPNG_08084 [Cytospora leucostoma]